MKRMYVVMKQDGTDEVITAQNKKEALAILHNENVDYTNVVYITSIGQLDRYKLSGMEIPAATTSQEPSSAGQEAQA